MWRAPQARLEASVALAGPYTEQRMRALRTGVDLFRRSPGLSAVIKGPLGPARRALKPFPQLGEAGAHRMLLFAADHPILPVDARINRVGPSSRLRQRRPTNSANRRARFGRDRSRASRFGGSLSPRVPVPVPPRRRDVHGGRPALSDMSAVERLSGGADQNGSYQLSDATRRRSVLTCSQICACSSRSSSSGSVFDDRCRYVCRSRSAARKVVQVIGEQAAIAQLVVGGRVDGQQQLGHVARLREGVHPDVHALQVQQHPREDLRLVRVGEQTRLELGHIVILIAIGTRVAAEQIRQASSDSSAPP